MALRPTICHPRMRNPRKAMLDSGLVERRPQRFGVVSCHHFTGYVERKQSKVTAQPWRSYLATPIGERLERGRCEWVTPGVARRVGRRTVSASPRMSRLRNLAPSTRSGANRCECAAQDQEPRPRAFDHLNPVRTRASSGSMRITHGQNYQTVCPGKVAGRTFHSVPLEGDPPMSQRNTMDALGARAQVGRARYSSHLARCTVRGRVTLAEHTTAP